MPRVWDIAHTTSLSHLVLITSKIYREVQGKSLFIVYVS